MRVGLGDRLRAAAMHAGARFTVQYGENLRFAGSDLPAPRRLRVPTRHGRVPVDVYRPADDGSGRPTPAIVHLHGGAWLMRHPRMDDWWCRYLAATTGATVVNVDYTAAPYARYPVAQEQSFDVTAWVAGRGVGSAAGSAADLGVDGARLAVSGFSSGGGMAAAVCLLARDAGGPPLRAQVLGVPALDLATPVPHAPGMISADLRDLVRRVYFPDPATRTEPMASPLLAPDLTGLPPAVVLTAERDTLRRDGDAYAVRLRDAGVPVLHHTTPGVDHYFLTEDPGRARTTMALVAEHLRAHLA